MNATATHPDPFLSPTAWGFHRYRDFESDAAIKMVASHMHVVLSVFTAYLTLLCIKPSKGSSDTFKQLRVIWNTIFGIVSLLTAIHVLPHTLYIATTQGISSSVCTLDDSLHSGPTAFWCILFTVSKVFDLGDTVFLVLGGNAVPVVHWFHRTTVLPWMWYLLRNDSSILVWSIALSSSTDALNYWYNAMSGTISDRLFRQRWEFRVLLCRCWQLLLQCFLYTAAAWQLYMKQSCDSSATAIAFSLMLVGLDISLLLQTARARYGLRDKAMAFGIWVYSKFYGLSLDQESMSWQRPDLPLSRRFQDATRMAAMLFHAATTSDLLTLYGSYKQATCGPIPDSLPEPSGEKEKRKWAAWKAVRNLSKEEAQLEYIKTMDVLLAKSQKKQQEAQARRAQRPTTTLLSQDSDPFVLYPIKIAGIGVYLPKRIVRNEDLEKMAGCNFTLEGKRTGVVERRWADIDGGETVIQNAANAIRQACDNAGIRVSDVDLIIGGFGQHQLIPDDACLVQAELGLGDSGVRAFTIHATCLSFFVCVDLAGSLMRQGRYQCVAVYSSCINSVGLNPSDPHTFGLFGDGAAAVILTPSNSESAVHLSQMETYGIGADLCQIAGGGSNRPPWHPKHDQTMETFKMDGEATMALASDYMGGALERFIPGLQKGLKGLHPCEADPLEIDWVVPHQPSALALDSLRIFGWTDDKVLRTIHKFGNCVCSSIPLTLWDGVQSGKIKRGDKVLLCGTAAGLSFGLMLLTY